MLFGARFESPLAILPETSASEPKAMTSDSQISPADYILALCNTAEESKQSLGTAVRFGMSNAQFQFEVTKVIHSIVTFSPAVDAVATDLLG